MIELQNFYAQKEFLLQKSLTQFIKNVGFFPQIGVELEFYLLQKNSLQSQNYSAQNLLEKNLQAVDNQALVADYISQLSQFFSADKTIYKIEKEQGVSQIEIKIAPHSNLLELAKKIVEVKIAAQKIAKNLLPISPVAIKNSLPNSQKILLENNFIASFAAQPLLEDCGSALQFNFSLHNENGENLFAKSDEEFLQNINFSNKKNQEKLLNNTIAGMLDSIDSAMVFYAPHQSDYLRFNLEINRALHKKGKFTAPVNICFGNNNRTAAVRVMNARVEFRVVASGADSFLAMAFLLNAIGDAINNNKLPQDFQKIYGNAFDEQYSLEKLPQNLESAEENFLKLRASFK